MHVLLSPGGSRGDVQPMLALGVRLKSKGHRVSMQAAPNFRAWIEAHGLEFHPFGPDVEALSRQVAEKLRDPVFFVKLGLDMLPQMFEETRVAARGVDVMIGAGANASSASVAEMAGVPYFYTVYCPQLIPSYSHAPMTMPFLQGLPRLANVLPWKMTFLIGNVFGLPALNRERAKLGLGPTRDVYRAILAGTSLLLEFDEVLAPVPADTGISVTHSGPWFLEETTPLPDDVDRFLRQPGAPVVYAGFGSMVTSDAERLTELIVEAAELACVRVLLSAGWARIGGGDLPAHAHAVGALSHPVLFPRVAAAIHHGGAGTTHSALRAGTPQVIVPHLLDQYYWSRRVEALGIGVRTAIMSRLTARQLATAIRAALDPSTAASARKHGARVRAAGTSGIDAAVARIEACART